MTLALNTQFLRGEMGPSAQIWGEWFLPTTMAERFPAAILMHGSTGVQNFHKQWASDLNQVGIAAFVVDSFTPRGVATTTTLPRLIDAYRALAFLTHHPRIDASRIALIGWSQGGAVSLYAGMRRFQAMYGPANGAFVAYGGIYGACNFTVLDETQHDGRPMRMFHSTADTQALIGPCRDDVARLQQTGLDITLTELPDVHHRYDDPEIPTTGITVGPSSGHCTFLESPNHQLVNEETGQAPTDADPCVVPTGMFQYNLPAHLATRQAVLTFLRDVFASPH